MKAENIIKVQRAVNNKFALTRFLPYFVVGFQKGEFMGLSKLGINCVFLDFFQNQSFFE